MIIPIDENTRIRGTTMCWNLETYRAGGKTPGWVAEKYFSTFQLALSAAMQREIRTHPAETLAEAIEAVEAISRRYGNILEGALEQCS